MRKMTAAAKAGKKIAVFLAVYMLVLSFTGCSLSEYVPAAGTSSAADLSEIAQDSSAADLSEIAQDSSAASGGVQVSEDGEYNTKDEVALYLHLYGHLSSNYITKKEAEKLGWNSSEGNLDEVAPGKSIGGSKFGNYQGLLPKGSYKECDIGYEGGYRGAARIIYSTDGRIYYTDDHYKTFTQLY